MSVLTVEEATAAKIGTNLSTEALQAAIDGEEAWLARRIGPLEGERTERFALSYIDARQASVLIMRPADTVEVTIEDADGNTTDVSDEVEIRQRGYEVARLPNVTPYAEIVEVTYTPNDLALVKTAIKGLLALRLAEQQSGGYQSEQIGGYSYQNRPVADIAAQRASIARSLMRKAKAGSMRVLSSVPHGIAGSLGR